MDEQERIDEPKLFTQEELNKVVNDRLTRERKGFDERLQKAVSEREIELNQREQAILNREVRALAVDLLEERGLPRQLVDAVNLTDPDACARSMDALEGAFRQAVQCAVDQRMKGTPPRGGNTPDATRISAAFGL